MSQIHHANVILSEVPAKKMVFDILAKDLNFEIERNPDFLLLENESFGIDDVRSLERWAINRPFLGEVKVLLLITTSITSEAQNALLKMLEEPPLGTYFFINLGSLQNLLPTLLSRVRVLDFSKITREEKEESDDAQAFLRSGLKQKFALIKSLSKSEDKLEMRDLIRDLERVAYQSKLPAKSLKNILVAKTLVSARGASPRMLLEWLSGVL